MKWPSAPTVVVTVCAVPSAPVTTMVTTEPGAASLLPEIVGVRSLVSAGAPSASEGGCSSATWFSGAVVTSAITARAAPALSAKASSPGPSASSMRPTRSPGCSEPSPPPVLPAPGPVPGSPATTAATVRSTSSTGAAARTGGTSSTMVTMLSWRVRIRSPAFTGVPGSSTRSTPSAPRMIAKPITSRTVPAFVLTMTGTAISSAAATQL